MSTEVQTMLRFP